MTQNIYTLRKTFEEYGEKDLIKTVPRRGYLFKYEKPAENLLKIEREIYEEIEIVEEEETQNNSALPSAPNADAKYFYAAFAVIALAEKAVELEPAFSKALGNLAVTLAYNQKCEQAVALFPRIAQYMTNQGIRLEQEGNVLSTCGRCIEAVPTLLEAKKLFPVGRVVAYSAGYCYAKMNQPEKAREELLVLDKTKFNGVTLFGKILLHNALGENEKALDFFDDLYKTKDPRNLRIFYDPRLKDFRNEPRYKEITKELNLE